LALATFDAIVGIAGAYAENVPVMHITGKDLLH
jgi:TPP-dependent 2-oxoacid decarboxylase